MPFTLSASPTGFRSAYGPLEVVLNSPRSPVNTIAGESSIPISQVKLADATDVSIYGSPLEVGDLFVQHAAVPLGTWTAGQTMKVEGTDIDSYNAVWRILKVVTDKVIVINATHVGTATGGLLSKHYENYTVFAEVKMQATSEKITYELKPNSAGEFVLNPTDFAQRSFKDIFEIADPSLDFGLIDAETYITQNWSAYFTEGYNVPDADGVNVFEYREKLGDTLSIANLIAVNSVQPYHHIEEGTGLPDMLWEDHLEDYTVSTEEIRRRWLTFHPSTGSYDSQTARRVAYNDDHWLAFLWSGATETLRVKVDYTLSNGVTSSLYTDVSVSKKSYLMNVGADTLGLDPSVVKYGVSLYFGTTKLIAETWYTVENSCEPRTVFHALNSFGSIDTYGVDGKVNRSTTIKRQTVTKPNIRRTLTTAGDYNRRTYATTTQRGYSITTRKEPKAIVRWLCDEVIESPDVRAQIYNGDVDAYTYVIFGNEKVGMGYRASRLELEWSYGVDNRKQRR